MREAQAETMRKRGFITPKEAADIAGVSVGAVYQWIDAKLVTGIRKGRARYVKKSSLNDYMKEKPA